MTDTLATEGDAGTPTELLRLEAERQSLVRELDEIELLLNQARVEAERHEARRATAEQRFDEMLRPYAIQSGLRESHQQLLVQTQRAALMSAQIEVLEGKQRVLRRYAEGLAGQLAMIAREADGEEGAADGSASGAQRGGASREVLAAQEDLRRAIARQMHDGPAQSIANIALQAQVAQRLLASDAAAANRELDELRRLVQHALEATKAFIFEVRPMVLDDLGLLPTLRRATRERAQRSGITVNLESHGSDRRLEREVESSLFRVIDDAVAAYLARSSAEVSVRLDWTPEHVAVAVRSKPTAPPEDDVAMAAAPTPATARRGEEVPAALADMIAEQQADDADRAAIRWRAFGLPESLWRELDARARTVGISLTLSADGLRLDASVDTPSA